MHSCQLFFLRPNNCPDGLLMNKFYKMPINPLNKKARFPTIRKPGFNIYIYYLPDGKQLLIDDYLFDINGFVGRKVDKI
jgi:hypothetical protein